MSRTVVSQSPKLYYPTHTHVSTGNQQLKKSIEIKAPQLKTLIGLGRDELSYPTPVINNKFTTTRDYFVQYDNLDYLRGSRALYLDQVYTTNTKDMQTNHHSNLLIRTTVQTNRPV